MCCSLLSGGASLDSIFKSKWRIFYKNVHLLVVWLLLALWLQVSNNNLVCADNFSSNNNTDNKDSSFNNKSSNNRNNKSNNEMRIKRDLTFNENLESYLVQFGYMPRDGAFALRTEESIRHSIKELQEFAGIPATGRLDENTVKLLRKPRCGLPDKFPGDNRFRRKRYAIHGQKWPYTDLTWRLNLHNLGNLDPYEVRYIISRALDVWARHSKLTFRERDDDKADIQIHFYRGNHGDNFPFDGKGVVLAHAFFPNSGRSIDVHFDADETWVTTGDNEDGTNLFNVATHEIGHSLGLSHSNANGSLMNPWYSDLIVNGFEFELPEDDRLGIQALYGAREDRQWEQIPVYHPNPNYPTRSSPTQAPRRPTTQKTARPRVGYDPRYPHGKHPVYTYTPRRHYPDKNHPHKPKHEYPYKPDRKYHKHHDKVPLKPTFPPPTTTTYRNTYRPPQAPRHYPSKEFPDENPPPDTCNTSYDAVAIIRREVFIFKGPYFWRINDNGLMPGYPVKITRLWTDLPHNLTHVDAVYERLDADRKIVFFIDDKYYIVSGSRVERGYPKPLTDLGLPSTIRKIDGAMVWGHNGKTYFYSGNLYWRFDEEVQKVELDYPRNMAMWKGVGTDIDAVFQWKDGRTYFFKDKHFWKFNDGHMRIEHGYPKPSAPFWMGCTNNMEESDLPGDKLPYTDIQSSINSSTSNKYTILIHLMLVAIILRRYIYY